MEIIMLTVGQVCTNCYILHQEGTNSCIVIDPGDEAKKIAAFEITKLIHGEEEALKAKKTSEELFENSNSAENMPVIEILNSEFDNEKISIVDLVVKSGVASSKGQARTLIEQGGISLNDEKIIDVKKFIPFSEFKDKSIILKKGKKIFIKIKIKE